MTRAERGRAWHRGDRMLRRQERADTARARRRVLERDLRGPLQPGELS